MNGLDQIVIDPADRTDALMEAVQRLADAAPVKIGRITHAKLMVRWLLHPVVHTMVTMKQYDRASDRLIETGWKVCMFCSRVRR